MEKYCSRSPNAKVKGTTIPVREEWKTRENKAGSSRLEVAVLAETYYECVTTKLGIEPFNVEPLLYSTVPDETRYKVVKAEATPM